MIGIEFYPTTVNLIEKMLSGINLLEIGSFLEPQAGKGDIADYICEKWNQLRHRWSATDEKPDIDCIEIDANLRHVLKGKEYRVIHDDFLTFQTYKQYDLIVMNPPFSNGDRHLLKALALQEHGGRVVCLLNAETLKKPFTRTRKDLARKLAEYRAEIEYISRAFKDAERPTGVEVALIKVHIPAAENHSVIIEGLQSKERYEKTFTECESIVDADPIVAIVDRYNFEVKAGLMLIDEYEAMKPYLLNSINGNVPIFELRVDGARGTITRNEYIKKVRSKYWEALFMSDVFMNNFTSKLRSEYIGKIKELQHYDFSLYNIYSIKAEVIKTMNRSIEETIIALFDEFSHKHHWYDETSKNIHYYNGWRTNQSWYINEKVIIPLSGYSWGNLRYTYGDVFEKLSDIEKVFNYLDGGRTDHVDLLTTLRQAQDAKITTKIQLKYFTVTFYKKGTCHFRFTNLELLKKFNLYGSQQKGRNTGLFMTTFSLSKLINSMT
ncbi:MAG TPA: DUF4942 domain-containing protein [Bacillota bacterium]|nr:DUF4942 domain-containing protein [Bacillota bacterium]